MTTPVVWMPGDVRTEVRLTSAETGGALCLLLDEPPPGWALPPHHHRNESETIHILEGRFDLNIGGEPSVLEPGDTAHVPVGVIHSGGNIGEHTGKRLVIFSPAGVEGFWLEVGKRDAGGTFDTEAVLEAAGRWGWEFVRT